MTSLISAAAQFNSADSSRTPEAEGEKSETIEIVESPRPDENQEVTANETETEATETPSGDTEVETFNVEYNGETHAMTLEALIKGNMMERDYQFKRGKTAEIERAAQTKFDEFNQQFQAFETDLKAEADWFNTSEAKELREDDPDGYLKKMESIQSKTDRYKRAKDVRDKELNEQKTQRTKVEQDKLLSAIPDWLDASTQQADIAEIVKTLSDNGFSQDDINSIQDHRLFLMARKLSKLASIEASDISGKKVNNAPKSATPGTTVAKETSQNKTRQDLRAKLKKSGRFADAMRLLSS